MNLRFEKATENDFERMRKFIVCGQYHWLTAFTTIEERMESIHKARFPAKPRFNKRGRIVRAAERYASYSEADFLKQMEFVKKEKGEVLIILDGEDVIGFVYWRKEMNNRRIVLFPLDFQYQNAETIRTITRKLMKKIKSDIKLFVISAEIEGKKILSEVPEISIGIKPKAV